MISDLMEDSLKIRDTRKDRGNKADGANARIIDLLHGIQPSLDADGIVHIIFKAFVQCIDRPRDRDLSQFFQEEDSVYLTKEQKKLLDLWAKLSPVQREAVTKMLCAFLYIEEEP